MYMILGHVITMKMLDLNVQNFDHVIMLSFVDLEVMLNLNFDLVVMLSLIDHEKMLS